MLFNFKASKKSSILILTSRLRVALAFFLSFLYKSTETASLQKWLKRCGNPIKAHLLAAGSPSLLLTFPAKIASFFSACVTFVPKP